MCIMVDGPAGHRTRETSSPAQCAGHSVRQALFVKLKSQTNSLSFDLRLSGVVSLLIGARGVRCFIFYNLKN